MADLIFVRSAYVYGLFLISLDLSVDNIHGLDHYHQTLLICPHGTCEQNDVTYSEHKFSGRKAHSSRLVSKTRQ